MCLTSVHSRVVHRHVRNSLYFWFDAFLASLSERPSQLLPSIRANNVLVVALENYVLTSMCLPLTPDLFAAPLASDESELISCLPVTSLSSSSSPNSQQRIPSSTCGTQLRTMTKPLCVDLSATRSASTGSLGFRQSWSSLHLQENVSLSMH